MEINHTSAKTGYALSRMNATHLQNIYMPYCSKTHVKGEENLRGLPIWSNHLKEVRQIFYVFNLSYRGVIWEKITDHEVAMFSVTEK